MSFVTPEITIEKIFVEDVISTSGITGGGNTGEVGGGGNED